MTWTNDDILLSMVREFSVAGALGNAISAEHRRECIRVEIIRKGRAKLPFFDSGWDYATAYTRCFGKPLELRRYPRDERGVVVPHGDEESDEDELE